MELPWINHKQNAINDLLKGNIRAMRQYKQFQEVQIGIIPETKAARYSIFREINTQKPKTTLVIPLPGQEGDSNTVIGPYVPFLKGGHSYLFAGWDHKRKQPIVGKTIKLNHDIKTREQLIIQEVEKLAVFQHRFAIIPLACERVDGDLMLIEPYLNPEEWPSLNQALPDSENPNAEVGLKLEREDLARIAAQVSELIEYGARFNVFHEDIKPDSIHFSRDGICKVIDFGVTNTRDESNDTLTGTYPYLAPEIASSKGGSKISMQSEFYALGITLYQLITKSYPFFSGKNGFFRAVTKGEYDYSALENNSIAPERADQLKEFFKEVFVKDPKMRPESAHEFTQKFINALGLNAQIQDLKLPRLKAA